MTKLKIKNQFWVIPNKLLQNKDITLKAKWLFGYLQSKPDNWNFSADRIMLETKDWRDWIRNWLKELEKFWYLERKKYHNEKWHWEHIYILNDNPTENIPKSEKATSEDTAIKKTISTKKDIVINNNILSKDNIEQSSKEKKETDQNNFSINSVEQNYLKEKEKKSAKKEKENYWNIEINNLIDEMKDVLLSRWFIYKFWKYERMRAKNILSAKEFTEFAKKYWRTNHELAIAILRCSLELDFWRWKIYNCTTLYKHWGAVYNDYLNKKSKEQEKKVQGDLSKRDI